MERLDPRQRRGAASSATILCRRERGSDRTSPGPPRHDIRIAPGTVAETDATAPFSRWLCSARRQRNRLQSLSRPHRSPVLRSAISIVI